VRINSHFVLINLQVNLQRDTQTRKKISCVYFHTMNIKERTINMSMTFTIKQTQHLRGLMMNCSCIYQNMSVFTLHAVHSGMTLGNSHISLIIFNP